MATAAKCKQKTYPQLDEATSFVEYLQIFKPESPVLFENQSRLILYQVVVRKRRNEPSAETNKYFKRNGSKALAIGAGSKFEDMKKENNRKLWMGCIQS